ncbi:MAG TPA: glycosyl transferase family 2 [Prolixibacteraceae bacterium]|jgi:GT2 family glycosyltransferase|nr:glycosyl transferase family 2 [Prolixibacteraceae bacterium]
MKLSIVIVNYNVKYFLEQCLYAAIKAASKVSSEIIVVDNDSVDGSCQMVSEKFPEVTLIANNENVGFSKANNQAIRIAKGQYILLLNPDTVVEEDSFMKIVGFMDQTPDAGGLGVKMIDGKGRFLPESKRGLPTPEVAFWKMFGFSSLFPHSKRFGRYHLGYLDKDQVHEVDVLAGAFMLLRRQTLDKVGLLDEDYFMYGEDIDLSYRITQGGYKNYYFPQTTIIHYKGESTKKGSINYVKVFYNAMIIFAKKHFSKGNARRYALLINLAIYFRALLTLAARFVKSVILPLADAFFIYLGFAILLPNWESYKFERGYYPPEYLHVTVPIYILIWICSIWLNGGYRKNIRFNRIFKGLLWGAISILIFYSLVDESMRYSRALLLLGSGWAFLTLPAYRYLLYKLKLTGLQVELDKQKRIAVVAAVDESKRISELIANSGLKIDTIGFVSPDHSIHQQFYLGNIHQLKEIIRINKIDELIFSSGDIPSQEIIRIMLDLSDLNIDYKIAPPESLSIIGSNSISTAGDLYVVHINSIAKENNKQNKRAFDLVVSAVLITFSPGLVWFIGSKSCFFHNISQVFIGNKSWVGYCSGTQNHLPPIKKGILSPASLFPVTIPEKKKDELNIVYAKDYRLMNDLEIVLKAWKNIGKS